MATITIAAKDSVSGAMVAGVTINGTSSDGSVFSGITPFAAEVPTNGYITGLTASGSGYGLGTNPVPIGIGIGGGEEDVWVTPIGVQGFVSEFESGSTMALLAVAAAAGLIAWFLRRK